VTRVSSVGVAPLMIGRAMSKARHHIRTEQHILRAFAKSDADVSFRRDMREKHLNQIVRRL
jgi:hypothetical protein